MPRPRNPRSERNRNESFTGAEVQAALAREAKADVSRVDLAASKRARVVRDAREFDSSDLQALVRSPMTPPAAYSWSIADIVAARDAQMAGRFRLAARLAESFGTDGSLFTARGVRLAPVQSLDVDIKAGRGPRSDKIADEADALFGVSGASISRETETSIRSALVDHGVAFGKISWTVRPDGSRVDPILSAWPIEFVWWDAARGYFYTQVRMLSEETDPTPETPYSMPTQIGSGYAIRAIVHGDGQWVVFQKSEVLPFRADAALLPAALVWARIAFALRDWSKGASTHGNAKVVGELPADTPLTDSDGAMTSEAAAFLNLVQAIASQESPVGIKPAGSKIEYMVNTSHAWEVWKELVSLSQSDAARIYLGTDGVLGAQGGAPGVDVQALFGVAVAKIQGDLACIERGIQTGLISPWCALNFGDDKQSPTRRYVFPDPDAAQVRADFATRNAAFLSDVKGYREGGFVLTQTLVDTIAKAHGVPSPLLPVANAPPAAAPGASVPYVGESADATPGAPPHE